jgi:hypothetical protein
MKKTLFVLIALIGLVMVSCQKTEISSDELTTEVIFSPIVEEDLTVTKSSVNRDVFGDDFINVAISGMDISALHDASAEMVSDYYDVVDDGSGENQIKLEGVRLGWNTFTATTTSYVETPWTDPVYGESDGFSSHHKIERDRYPFNLSNDIIESSDSAVKYLRMIQPFVEFEGTARHNVVYQECEDACNEVQMNMEAKQGRWIATVEFEDTRLAHSYEAKVTVSHDAGEMGPAPSRTVDVRSNGDNVPFAWFYMTHAQCNENLNITMKIQLKERGGNTVLRTWNLSRDNYPTELSVTNGIDRWVKIVIAESSLKSGCVDFNFGWEWDIDDNNIDL